MPQSTYRITTDKGTYDITVDDAAQPPPLPAAATRGMVPPSTATSRAPNGTLMDLAPQPDEQRQDLRRMVDGLALAIPGPPTSDVIAAARARLAQASGLGERLVAGGKEIVEHSTPALKYEVAKSTLKHFGVPDPVAIPLALALSGYRGNGVKPTAAATTAAETAAVREAEVAATASRGASTPGAPTPPVAAASPAASAPSAPTPSAAPRWSPQQVRNEVGLAMRRAQMNLTETQRLEADRLVRQGASPAEAVQQVAAASPAASAATTTPAPAAPATTTAPAKLHLSAAEQPVYSQLRLAGKTHEEAAAAIEQLRALAQKLGMPSSETVRTTTAARNAKGRWPGAK